MFWDDEKDNKDTQRIKNFVLLKIWGTNQERNEILSSPFFWIFWGLSVVVAIVIGYCVAIV